LKLAGDIKINGRLVNAARRKNTPIPKKIDLFQDSIFAVHLHQSGPFSLELVIFGQ
jgi:hypothetical protein